MWKREELSKKFLKNKTKDDNEINKISRRIVDVSFFFTEKREGFYFSMRDHFWSIWVRGDDILARFRRVV